VHSLSGYYATLCERIGVPYLKIAHVLSSSPTWSREAVAGDGAHPNRGGYDLVARVVSNWPAWRNWIDPACPTRRDR